MNLESPESGSDSRVLNDRFLGGMLIVVLLAVVAVFVLTLLVLWKGNSVEAKSLLEEVTEEPRNGVVVSNVGDEICLILLNKDGQADKIKSCVHNSKVFNYGVPSFGQPAIAAPLGDIYKVHRFKVFGVSDGLVFYPDRGYPIPAPTVTPVEVKPEGK